MICCKIITNYDEESGDFAKLLDDLGKKGNFLWNEGVLYFSNESDMGFSITNVKKILKKSGYSNFFIGEYTEKNPPKETIFVNSWLYDKIVKINYNTFETISQEKFKEINKQLDSLNQEIKELKEKEGEPNGQGQEDRRAKEEGAPEEN